MPSSWGLLFACCRSGPFCMKAGALLLADLHLGDPASFRAGGIPVRRVTDRDLGRLGALITRTGVEHGGTR